MRFPEVKKSNSLISVGIFASGFNQKGWLQPGFEAGQKKQVDIIQGFPEND
jgi:hypothetical protein